MRFNTSDLRLLEKFNARLREACIEMEDGTPMTRALSDCGIGRSTFYTLIRGLRKSGSEPDTDLMDSLRHPAWQDTLAADICGETEYLLPDDFEETLASLMKKYLSDEENQLIDLLYIKGQSIGKTAETLGLEESDLRFKKSKALKKLREHKNELLVGNEYLKRYDELKTLYDANQKELQWMAEALRYLKSLEEDLSSDELPQDERRFLKRHGFNRLSDVMNVRPKELAGKLASTDTRFDTKVSLDKLGFNKASVDAFHRISIDTAEDLLELTPDEVMSLPAERIADVIQAYRKILKTGDIL